MNIDWLNEAIERVVKKKKAQDVSLLLTVENENLSRFAENRIIQNTTRHRINLNVSAIWDNRQGRAETSDTSSRGILSALRRAEAAAKASPQDHEFIDLPGKQRYPKIDRFFRQTAELPVESKAKVIREVTSEASSRKMTSAGIFRSGDYKVMIGNTRGLVGEHGWTEAEFSITARTDSSAGSAVAEEEDVTKINPQALAIEAFRTAEMGRNPKPLKPGSYKTLITARALGEMMPFVAYQMNRRAADEGRSYFKGKLGKKIVSKKISIIADPLNPENPGIPIDLMNDGIAVKKNAYIEDGVLANLWCTRYWAKKQHIPVVSPSMAVTMSGDDKGLDQLIKKIDHGLLAMHLWYIRYVNPMELILTGTSRDGLFLVENGQIKHSVKNLRFNDSPLRMLQNPIAFGIPERRGGSMMLPPILVKDFNWASSTTF